MATSDSRTPGTGVPTPTPTFEKSPGFGKTLPSDAGRHVVTSRPPRWHAAGHRPCGARLPDSSQSPRAVGLTISTPAQASCSAPPDPPCLFGSLRSQRGGITHLCKPPPPRGRRALRPRCSEQPANTAAGHRGAWARGVRVVDRSKLLEHHGVHGPVLGARGT